MLLIFESELESKWSCRVTHFRLRLPSSLVHHSSLTHYDMFIWLPLGTCQSFPTSISCHTYIYICVLLHHYIENCTNRNCILFASLLMVNRKQKRADLSQNRFCGCRRDAPPEGSPDALHHRLSHHFARRSPRPDGSCRRCASACSEKLRNGAFSFKKKSLKKWGSPSAWLLLRQQPYV